MSEYTHFSATIHLPGHVFPLRGRIDNPASLLLLANNGTSPRTVTPALQSEANRIRHLLAQGQQVATKTATIRPE